MKVIATLLVAEPWVFSRTADDVIWNCLVLSCDVLNLKIRFSKEEMKHVTRVILTLHVLELCKFICTASDILYVLNLFRHKMYTKILVAKKILKHFRRVLLTLPVLAQCLCKHKADDRVLSACGIHTNMIGVWQTPSKREREIAEGALVYDFVCSRHTRVRKEQTREFGSPWSLRITSERGRWILHQSVCGHRDRHKRLLAFWECE